MTALKGKDVVNVERADFEARRVITRDPNLKLDKVDIPEIIVLFLVYPERG